MTSIKKYISAGLAIFILLLTFILRHMIEDALGITLNSALNSTSQSVPSVAPFLTLAKGVEVIIAIVGVVGLFLAIYGVLRKHRIL